MLLDWFFSDYQWYRRIRGGLWKFIPNDKMSKYWIKRENER